MMPNEGRVAMLRALLEKPMMLHVFGSGPKADNAVCSIEDFKFAAGTSPHALQLRDWLIDEARGEATGDKRAFRFSSPGAEISGWVLYLKADRTVIGFDRFDDLYRIRSKEDVLSIRPRIRKPGA